MVQSSKNYPFQNKSNVDLPDEEWKDIPDFEGSYQASNLGRIKSLDRTVPHPRLKKQFIKGRILSQSIHKNKNVLTDELMVDLRVSFCLENKQYYFNTRRIIYRTFINPKLNFDEDGLYILNKDADGYNNSVDNLILATKSEKVRRAIDRNRLVPSLMTADRSAWPKTFGGYTKRKPVAQFDLNGNLLAEFESITEASQNTGVDHKSIGLVAKGIYLQCKGFKWKYL